MKNAPYKIFRCPECTMNKRVREPESKPPPCPKCGSLKAYFSTNWYISITENGKTIPKPISQHKSVAAKAINATTIPEDKPEVLTWKKATEIFLTYKENTAKTETYRFYSNHISMLDNYLSKRINNLDEITPETVAKFIGHRRKEVTNSTINHDITALLHMFNLLSNGTLLNESKKPYLTKNCLEGFKKLQNNDNREVIWEPSEVRDLIANAAHPWIKLAILLAVDGALRKRTINYLKISYLQMHLSKIAIPASSRKKGKYVHYIDMTSRLRAALEEHLLFHPKNTDYLFPNKRDKSKPWSKLEHYWQQTKKKVGVEGKRFHDLKATGGTLFFLAMEDLRQTSLFLDHQDVNMTTRYIRIAEARKQKNLEKFEKILES